MNTLNPELYSALLQAFGTVHIVNPGLTKQDSGAWSNWITNTINSTVEKIKCYQINL